MFRTDKTFPGRLERRKELNIFRNFARRTHPARKPKKKEAKMAIKVYLV